MNTLCLQANLENVREFKVALEQDRTAGMANFTEALTRAFNILERVSVQIYSGVCCNLQTSTLHEEMIHSFRTETKTRYTVVNHTI